MNFKHNKVHSLFAIFSHCDFATYAISLYNILHSEIIKIEKIGCGITMKTQGIKYTKASYLDKQVAFFREHARANPNLMGMEYEHFLVDAATMRSYDYFEPDGQGDLLTRLSENGWDIFLEEDGFILGLIKDGHTITLEPGGQVEISLSPFSEISEIVRAYESVIGQIIDQMKPNQRLASIGYHPLSKIDSLTLLPKKRYGLMYDYFKDNGVYCHNMMKGTSATQVSIDYSDETDFIKKFRVANYLAPVLAALFDAAPIFEGALTEGRNMRARIWAETDIKRSKLIPGSLTETFDFRAYAAYLLSLSPILIYSEGALIKAPNQPLEALLPLYPFTETELEHHTSMVFPDVRLKKFIEIRMPDAMPYPYSLAVTAVIKGLFYNAENLEKYYKQSLEIQDSWVIKQNKCLIKGMESFELDALKASILNDVLTVLTVEERTYLEPFAEIIHQEGSMAQWLQKLYRNDIETFKSTIYVNPKKSEAVL